MQRRTDYIQRGRTVDVLGVAEKVGAIMLALRPVLEDLGRPEVGPPPAAVQRHGRVPPLARHQLPPQPLVPGDRPQAGAHARKVHERRGRELERHLVEAGVVQVQQGEGGLGLGARGRGAAAAAVGGGGGGLLAERGRRQRRGRQRPRSALRLLGRHDELPAVEHAVGRVHVGVLHDGLRPTRVAPRRLALVPGGVFHREPPRAPHPQLASRVDPPHLGRVVGVGHLDAPRRRGLTPSDVQEIDGQPEALLQGLVAEGGGGGVDRSGGSGRLSERQAGSRLPRQLR